MLRIYTMAILSSPKTGAANEGFVAVALAVGFYASSGGLGATGNYGRSWHISAIWEGVAHGCAVVRGLMLVAVALASLLAG